MTKRTITDRILELARSETKRWGGAEPSLTHVAFVFANYWKKEFTETFGGAGRERVENMLRMKAFRGDEQAIRDLLTSAEDVPAAIKAVHDALADGEPPSEEKPAAEKPAAEKPAAEKPAAEKPPAAKTKSPRADDHEAWLTSLVEDRLESFAATPAARTKDELYVLVGTMKIAGFEETHEVAKARMLHVLNAEPPQEGVLSQRTERFLQRVEPAEAGLRPSESTRIAGQLLRPHAPIVAIVGEPGVGRTSLVREVAARLAESGGTFPVWRMAPETIIANPASSLRMALDDVNSPAVIVVDDLDEIADLGTQEPDRGLLEMISDARLHPHARMVVVVNQRRLSRVGVLNQALDEWMYKVTLNSLPPGDLADVVTAAGGDLVAASGLSLGPGVVEAALSPAETGAASVHPGLALDRIDAAIGRARLEKATVVGVEHMSRADGTRSVETESKDLVEVLRERVRGQDEAIRKVAERLALTRAGLDLRPERPNGVFLFAGPTGVGKTELATQIALAEYGSPDQLIRLDMSEYGEYAFAMPRLIGVGQGYVGQDQPDGWLTTLVARKPRSVVLLDEIEKAHPAVWNVFLQVFDAGRLTDGRGVTADFSETIIIMTSNIGVREANRRAAGFGAETGPNAERQLAVIKETMAPELINRLDEIVLFAPLSMEAILEIAGAELDATRARLGASGWSIEYADDVPAWLAATGYDPAFGARHLMRNIEREFLGLLAKTGSRRLRITVRDEALVAEER